MCSSRYILIFLWWMTEFKLVWTFDTVTVVDVVSELPEEPLSCWTCKHTEGKPNPNCVTMTNKTMIPKTKCRRHESYCQIKKRTSNSHVEWFERSCAQTCDTICQQFKTLKQCNWCCAHSYCNAGNHGNRLVTDSFMTMILFCLYFI